MKVNLKNINGTNAEKIKYIAWGIFFVYMEEIYIRTPACAFTHSNCIRLKDGLCCDIDENDTGFIIPRCNIKKLVFKGFKEDRDE